MITEPVEIWLKEPMKKLCDGVIYIGEYGCLYAKLLQYGKEYTVADFPGNYLLLPSKDIPAGPLLTEWRQIEQSMARQRDEAHK